MRDFLDLCLHRQSCRNFSDKPVEHEVLVHCVEAARLAPSACNSQPWKFVVVETPHLVSEVALCAQQIDMNPYASGAKAFFVVIEDHAVLMPKLRCIIDSQYFAKNDVGAAIEHLCLEAESLGVGTCIMGVFNRERLCELLNLPIDTRIAMIVAVGYAEDSTIRPKNRKPLAEIATFV